MAPTCVDRNSINKTKFVTKKLSNIVPLHMHEKKKENKKKNGVSPLVILKKIYMFVSMYIFKEIHQRMKNTI